MTPAELLQRAQAQVDARTYPPTHDYDVASLEPRGPLADRLAKMHAVAPRFFHQEDVPGEDVPRLLDIGSSKGFFSLYAAEVDFLVDGVEPDGISFNVAQTARDARVDAGLGSTMVRFHCESFRDMLLPENPDHRYSRIIVGNVHHYLFVDAGGWDFIAKLAVLCAPGAQVLIEGPAGMTCADMKNVIPEHLRDEFSEDKMIAAMSRHFQLVASTASPNYTPDRKIRLWTRRLSWCDVVTDAGIGADLIPYNLGPSKARVTEAPGWGVRKNYDQPRLNEAPLWPSVALAAEAPGSNGCLASVGRGANFSGWYEPRLMTAPLEYYKRQVDCLRAWARRNIFLTRLGYVDPDSGTVNFVPLENDELIHFDKNSVMPAGMMRDDDRVDRAMRTMRQSYKLDIDEYEMRCALISGDARVMERWFTRLLRADFVEK